jgi:hypothetical protein
VGLLNTNQSAQLRCPAGVSGKGNQSMIYRTRRFTVAMTKAARCSIYKNVVHIPFSSQRVQLRVSHGM